MITDHYVFHPPKNEDQVIWRYLDFTKLVSLLDSEELYFSRADQFNDKFEGSLPRPLALVRQQMAHSMVASGVLRAEYLEQDLWASWAKNHITEIGISCWHMNDHESAAMWKLYLKSNEGIAIRSTYKRLHSCLHNSAYDLNIGLVNYIDYEVDVFPLDNGLYPFMHKRKSFEHEYELRAVMWFIGGENKKLLTDKNLSCGVGVKVNLHELIESIYVSPDAPNWLAELVKSVIKKYNLDVMVHQSKINASPIY